MSYEGIKLKGVRALYHYTDISNLDTIFKEGLIPGHGFSVYGSPPDKESIWLDRKRYKIKTRGWAVIKVYITSFNDELIEFPNFNEVAHEQWVRYFGRIPPEDLIVVDMKKRKPQTKDDF